jgi:hypothetical protein
LPEPTWQAELMGWDETCPVCAEAGRPGVPGVERVTFRGNPLERLLGGRVEPPRPHRGPYAGTGFRLRRTAPPAPAFCAAHAPAARRSAADRLTLRAALRRLAQSGGAGS